MFSKLLLWVVTRLTLWLDVCFILNRHGITVFIFKGKTNELMTPPSFDEVQLQVNEVIKTISQKPKMVSLIAAAHLEDLVWGNIIPSYVLGYNGINTKTTKIFKLNRVRGLLSGLTSDGYIKLYSKFLISIIITKLSSKLFKKKHSSLFIVESLSGFRYTDTIKSLTQTPDIGTACLSDIKTHLRSFLSGQYLFFGIYYPISIKPRLDALEFDKVFLAIQRIQNFSRLFNINWPIYDKTYSYDKVVRHIDYLESQQRQQSKIFLCQHGVIGPLYFNGLRPGLIDQNLKFEFVGKWFPPHKPIIKAKKNTFDSFKRFIFFNEFLCDQKRQNEFIAALTKHKFKVFFKDRPTGDYFALSRSKTNFLVGSKSTANLKNLQLFRDLEELQPHKDTTLAIIFHSSILYELVLKGFNVVVVDNFLFDEKDLQNFNVESLKSVDLQKTLTSSI